MASQNCVTLQNIHDRAKQTRIQETEPTHFKHHTPLQENLNETEAYQKKRYGGAPFA